MRQPDAVPEKKTRAPIHNPNNFIINTRRLANVFFFSK
jgi:hypothetical protein